MRIIERQQELRHRHATGPAPASVGIGVADLFPPGRVVDFDDGHVDASTTVVVVMTT
jgi:hypothetical protein